MMSRMMRLRRDPSASYWVCVAFAYGAPSRREKWRAPERVEVE